MNMSLSDLFYCSDSTDYGDYGYDDDDDDEPAIINLIGDDDAGADFGAQKNPNPKVRTRAAAYITGTGSGSGTVDLTDSQPEPDLEFQPPAKRVVTYAAGGQAAASSSSSSSFAGKVPCVAGPLAASNDKVDQIAKQLVDISGRSLDLVKAVVTAYCTHHPGEINSETILGDCFDQLLGINDSTDITALTPLHGGANDPHKQSVTNHNSHTSFAPASSSSSSSSSSAAAAAVTPAFEIVSVKTPLSQVLEFFPSAKRTVVQRLLEQCSFDIGAVLAHMAEKGFEKEDAAPAPAPPSSSSSSFGNKKELDYTSTSWKVSQQYEAQALVQLQNEFPFLNKDSLKSLLRQHSHHFTPVLDKIRKAIGVPDHVLNASKAMPSKEIVVVLQRELGLKVNKTNRNGITPLGGPIDDVLSDEVGWRKRRWLEAMEKTDRVAAEELNVEIATEEGALIECGCCYTELPFDSLVQCSEGHLFCRTCLQHYVENRVFGEGRSSISCMNSEPCDGFFPDPMLRMSLPESVFNKYQEAVAKDMIKAAQINVCTCFHCQYQVEIESNAGHILKCPQCQRETCSLCGEESHIPLRCEEVEKKTQTSSRLTVEEAMTEARIRQCHRCRSRFYKTEGCNKMTCACGSKMCYICRKDINVEQYKHFCQTPNCEHKKCGKCRLFTDSEEDDRLAMLDAGRKSLAQVQQTAGADGALVDLDKLLEGGINPKAKAKPGVPPAAAVAVPPGFGAGADALAAAYAQMAQAFRR